MSTHVMVCMGGVQLSYSLCYRAGPVGVRNVESQPFGHISAYGIAKDGGVHLTRRWLWAVKVSGRMWAEENNQNSVTKIDPKESVMYKSFPSQYSLFPDSSY